MIVDKGTYVAVSLLGDGRLVLDTFVLHGGDPQEFLV
jgi:hypothetical protein